MRTLEDQAATPTKTLQASPMSPAMRQVGLAVAVEPMAAGPGVAPALTSGAGTGMVPTASGAGAGPLPGCAPGASPAADLGPGALAWGRAVVASGPAAGPVAEGSEDLTTGTSGTGGGVPAGVGAEPALPFTHCPADPPGVVTLNIIPVGQIHHHTIRS